MAYSCWTKCIIGVSGLQRPKTMASSLTLQVPYHLATILLVQHFITQSQVKDTEGEVL